LEVLIAFAALVFGTVLAAPYVVRAYQAGRLPGWSVIAAVIVIAAVLAVLAMNGWYIFAAGIVVSTAWLVGGLGSTGWTSPPQWAMVSLLLCGGTLIVVAAMAEERLAFAVALVAGALTLFLWTRAESFGAMAGVLALVLSQCWRGWRTSDASGQRDFERESAG
jgi:hypothetical protein